MNRDAAYRTEIDIIELRRALIAWGRQHFRPFPWRLTRDPYRILIAEVMLHRTQVTQVIPTYESFVRHYPNIRALQKAKQPSLRRYLYPLGLHWRIPLMHKMAGEIVKKFQGMVPAEREALKSLPGVSDYIAGAVRCFAWNLPEVLLDTNTVRVTARMFGLHARESSRRSQEFRELLGVLVDPERPRDFNYALLDLADATCKAKQPPATHLCPLQPWCAYARGDTPMRSLTPIEMPSGTTEGETRGSNRLIQRALETEDQVLSRSVADGCRVSPRRHRNPPSAF